MQVHCTYQNFFLYVLSSFLMFWDSFFIFFLFRELVLIDSFRVYLLMTNSLIFPLSESVSIPFSWMIMLLDIGFWVATSFLFSIEKCHFLLVPTVSDEKFTDVQIGFYFIGKQMFISIWFILISSISLLKILISLLRLPSF